MNSSMRNCIVCGKEFEAKRATAKFCSSTCRSKYNRLSVAPDNLSVAVSVSIPEPIQPTQKETHQDFLNKFIGIYYTKEEPEEYPNYCETKAISYTVNPELTILLKDRKHP